MDINENNNSVDTKEEVQTELTENAKPDEAFAMTKLEAEKKAVKKNRRGRYQRLRRQLNITMVALLSVILVLAAALSVVSVNLISTKSIHRAIYDKSQNIELTQSGEWIESYNYSLGKIHIPALEGVPKSTYKDENFSTNANGFKEYYVDSELASYAGVDVSSFNGDIDWKAVKDAGVDFAMLRIGGRGYGEEGVLYIDEYFDKNYREAKSAGLSVGAYFFSQATNAEEAVEEARYAIDILDGRALDYPLAFDWEIIESAEYTRVDSVSPEELTLSARAFCDEVSSKGYTPAIYTGHLLAYYKLDLASLADIDIWYAYYNERPTFYYNYMMWQYSATGTVDGIEGEVDLNICFKNYN